VTLDPLFDYLPNVLNHIEVWQLCHITVLVEGMFWLQIALVLSDNVVSSPCAIAAIVVFKQHEWFVLSDCLLPCLLNIRPKDLSKVLYLRKVATFLRTIIMIAAILVLAGSLVLAVVAREFASLIA